MRGVGRETREHRPKSGCLVGEVDHGEDGPSLGGSHEYCSVESAVLSVEQCYKQPCMLRGPKEWVFDAKIEKRNDIEREACFGAYTLVSD